ncbi:MAG: cysteine hydrolase [Ruminococcaceae bacterium]|nr:cysteine hydrolase [Oscillospiraceae bacterium]
MSKALLIIDVQEGYIEKYSPLLIACINERIQEATANKELIVYVKNTKRLKSGKKTNELAKDLNVCSEYIICKEKASAFSNSKLQETLKQNHITKIEIAGIDGNSCIASTAIDSVKNTYKTIVQYKCIGIQNIQRFEKTKRTLFEKGIIVK